MDSGWTSRLARAGLQGGAHPQVGPYGIAFFTVVNALGVITNRAGEVVRGGIDPATGEHSDLIANAEAILAEHLINGTPLVTGWLEIPSEVVTAENVAQYVARETDDQVQYDYYQTYIAEHFADMQAAPRPYDDLRTLGEPQATPVP